MRITHGHEQRRRAIKRLNLTTFAVTVAAFTPLMSATANAEELFEVREMKQAIRIYKVDHLQSKTTTDIDLLEVQDKISDLNLEIGRMGYQLELTRSIAQELAFLNGVQQDNFDYAPTAPWVKELSLLFAEMGYIIETDIDNKKDDLAFLEAIIIEGEQSNTVTWHQADYGDIIKKLDQIRESNE